jgi:hypothetical protein
LTKIDTGDVGDGIVCIEHRQRNVMKKIVEVIRVVLEVIFSEMDTWSSFDWPSTECQKGEKFFCGAIRIKADA